jgi:hypothetical protein
MLIDYQYGATRIKIDFNAMLAFYIMAALMTN